jgi:hypothetical protein
MDCLNPDGPSADCTQLLNDRDNIQFAELGRELASDHRRGAAELQRETFMSALEKIRRFITQGDDDDRKRCSACGIAWIGQAIAINSQKFAKLMHLSKSTTNARLQSLGYSKTAMTADLAYELTKLLPSMRRGSPLMKQWTVRQRPTKTATNDANTDASLDNM